jgi:regulatory GntR family protein
MRPHLERRAADVRVRRDLRLGPVFRAPGAGGLRLADVAGVAHTFDGTPESGIRSSEIPVGRRLPSQSELEAGTGGVVSRPTIKSVLELLGAERLVQGMQGKGMFVAALPPPTEQA